jgi:DNA-binding MarR family transcriptional regulator
MAKASEAQLKILRQMREGLSLYQVAGQGSRFELDSCDVKRLVCEALIRRGLIEKDEGRARTTLTLYYRLTTKGKAALEGGNG